METPHDSTANLHVPVTYSLINIGRSKGNSSMVGWAAPNMEEIVTIVMAPTCVLKASLSLTSIEKDQTKEEIKEDSDSKSAHKSTLITSQTHNFALHQPGKLDEKGCRGHNQ